MLRRLIGLTAAAALSLAAAGPLLEKSDLWQGDEGGYKMYRIPGLVVTKQGTVLAYSEARRNSGSDWDTIDVVLRRSTNGGKSFSPQQVIARAPGNIQRSAVAIERKQAKPGDVTYNNPVAISDRDGTVHFLFCLEYARVFYMRSTDDGRTFSTPVEITAVFDAFRPEYPWRVVATGPGHGIQLANGRLLVPIWLALGTAGNGHHPSVNATVYSDDHGQTWHRGDIAIPGTPQFPDPNETTAAQLADGRVMLNVRTEARENRRAVVTSPDGATHWSPPRLQQDLPDPVCFASLVRLSTRKTGGRNRLLFSNPDNVTRADGRDLVSKDRKNLTVHLSYDEGDSWTVKRSLEPGSSGYSDLAVLPDGTILCLYETGAGAGSFPNRKLVLARFNLEWLTEGKDMWKRGKKVNTVEYLKSIDSPTLVNAIEVLEVRPNERGFTPVDIRCLFPEMGRMCGYAVTAQVETVTQMEPFCLDAFVELYRLVEQTPKPAVIVLQEIGGFAEYAAHCGEVMATFFTRLGAIGLVSDCAVRDLPEVRRLGFHYFARGSVASHANYRIARCGVPVQVRGMVVKPGDLVHADENGVITVPPVDLDAIRNAVDTVRRKEKAVMDFVKGAQFDLNGFRDLVVE